MDDDRRDNILDSDQLAQTSFFCCNILLFSNHLVNRYSIAKTKMCLAGNLKTAQSIFSPSDQSVLMSHPVAQGVQQLDKQLLANLGCCIRDLFSGQLTNNNSSRLTFFTDNHARDFNEQAEHSVKYNTWAENICLK